MTRPTGSLPILILIVFGGLSMALNAREQARHYLPGKIIVKFTGGSDLMKAWSAAGRSGELAELRSLLGAHDSYGYIGDATLQAWRQVRRRSLLKSFGAADDHITGICVLNCAAALDVRHLAAKLSRHPDIDFAEPMPQRDILFTPNDELLDQQYHLSGISAFDAWDLLPDDASAVVAIIDTGIEYDHPDLAPNIWNNPGETGTDGDGLDKRSNGIDDDNNGFVDDWRGWDFMSSTDGGDNDASFGNEHGVHVAGVAGAAIDNTIGVAGVGLGVKILPVKIGPDNNNSTSTFRGHEAILYAASLGADAINCSWGGEDFSFAERIIVDEATRLGSLVIGAVGNNRKLGTRYPGGYSNVVNVAWLTQSDQKAGGSNYHYTVDVAAPGTSIWSTLPFGNYGGAAWSGTSMAAPMISAVAAMIKMKYPQLSPRQIAAQLQGTTDAIDGLNGEFIGLIGSGKVNARRALGDLITAIDLVEYEVRDANGNGILEAGERVELYLSLQNLFAAIPSTTIFAESASNAAEPDFIDADFTTGPMASGESRSFDNDPIIFTVAPGIATDVEYFLRLNFGDENGAFGRETIRLVFNPSYLTLHENNVAITFNSEGHIGYNDYSDNLQGDGFRYGGSENLLYEGGIIIGSGSQTLLSTIHENSSFRKDDDFSPVAGPVIEVAADGSPAIGSAQFRDAEGAVLGLNIRQRIRQWPQDPYRDLVLLSYEITNTGPSELRDLHLGLYFDFDISIDGLGDEVGWRADEEFGFVRNAGERTLPLIGLKLVSDHQPHYYAFDNNGAGGSLRTVPTFNEETKWDAISGGIGRSSAGPGDVSVAIAAGPFDLMPDASEIVSFSLFGGPNVAALTATADRADEAFRSIGATNAPPLPLPGHNAALHLAPNPMSTGQLAVTVVNAPPGNARLELVDLFGRVVLRQSVPVDAPSWRSRLQTDGIAAGHYQVRMTVGETILSASLLVLR